MYLLEKGLLQGTDFRKAIGVKDRHPSTSFSTSKNQHQVWGEYHRRWFWKPWKENPQEKSS